MSDSMVAFVWPYFRVLLVFAIMLLLMKRKVGLGTAILAGSVLLGLFFWTPPGVWIHSTATALTDVKLLFLAAIVSLILVLSNVLERTGQSERLMELLSGYLVWRRLRLSFFPALIGLLPMPGGAVFSAPMVKSAARDLNVSDEQMVYINYWFRHIWEMVWPLYPGIILTAYLANVSILELLLYTWPGVAVSVAIGWWFFLRKGKLTLPADRPPREAALPPFSKVLYQGIPLIIAIAGSLGLEGAIWLTGLELPFELALVLALSLAILASVLQNRLSIGKFLDLIAWNHLGKMVYLILAIFVFKAILENGGVVDELSRASQGGSTLFLTCLLLPPLVGLVSGITVAYVGATFPLILALIAQAGLTDQQLPYLVLALFTGFAGVLASPVHACLLLTCEYFHSPLAVIWKRIAPPCLLFLAFGVLLFLFLNSAFF
ncbi:MAG: DUF401 family protein [Desulfovibrionales bacterium]